MNKNGEKEGKRSKGQEDNKLSKVNKTRGNDNKLPADGNLKQADDASNKFPNFSVLNEEERSAFFEALTAARKNVEKTGTPTRERFGTVHDQYLEYFNRNEKKEDPCPEEERSVASDPALLDGRQRDRTSLSLDAGDPPEETVDEKIRTPTSPPESLREGSEPGLLERCEAVIEEDTNKILGLYQKKKKKNAANKKPGEEPKAPKTQRKEPEEKPKKARKNENAQAPKVSESSLKARNTPRFDALNAEEKQVFFKILQEARRNIVAKSSDAKKEIAPLDSIMRRYRDDVETKSVFTAVQDPHRFGQGKKNLKVKVTLTSGDNERLLETIPEQLAEHPPEHPPEHIPEKKESVHEESPQPLDAEGAGGGDSFKGHGTVPDVDCRAVSRFFKRRGNGKSITRQPEQNLDLTEISKTEIAENDPVESQDEENLSKRARKKKYSATPGEINDSTTTTTTRKSASEEENPPTGEAKSSETFKKGSRKMKKPKKNPPPSKEVGKGSNEAESEGSLTFRESASSRASKPGKKKTGGGVTVTDEEKWPEKKPKGKSPAEVRKQEPEEVKSIGSNLGDVSVDRRNATQEQEDETSRNEFRGVEGTEDADSTAQEFEKKSDKMPENSERKKTRIKSEVDCQEENDEKFQRRGLEFAESPSKVESEGTEWEERRHREVEDAECQETRRREMEQAEEPPEQGKEERKMPKDESDVEERMAQPSVGGTRRDEETKESKSREVVWRENLEKRVDVAENATAVATPKVMIVDDNVIEKIRNLIHYLEAKAACDGRLEAEYMKLVVDYVDYLSKVMEALVRKKEREQVQVQNAFVAAQVHLKFDERGGGSRRKEPKPEIRKFVPRSVSEQDFAEHNFMPEKITEKETPAEKSSKNEADEGLLFPSDSDSSLESETDIQFVQPAPPNKKVLTTKIRLLQDLIKKRAEFVPGSTEEFRIVHHPQEEYVPELKPKTVKVIREDEEDAPTKDRKLKLIKAIMRFCRCGKKKPEEDGVFENLKGEAVRVDVTEDKRDAANATLNQSTIEVLKASGRKKIIEKYYSKE